MLSFDLFFIGISRYWADLPRASRPRLQANDENQLNMGVPGYWTAMLPIAGAAIDVLSWHAYPGYGLGVCGWPTRCGVTCITYSNFLSSQTLRCLLWRGTQLSWVLRWSKPS